MFCKQCGVQIKPGAHFCSVCGAILDRQGLDSLNESPCDEQFDETEQNINALNNHRESDEDQEPQLSLSATSASTSSPNNISKQLSSEETVADSFKLTKPDQTRSGVSSQTQYKLRNTKAIEPIHTNWWLRSIGVAVLIVIGYLSYSFYESNQAANQLRLELEQNAIVQKRELERLNQEKKAAEEQAENERHRREEADRQETRRREEQEAMVKKKAEEKANRLLQAQDLKARHSQEELALAESTRKKEVEAKKRYEQALIEADQNYSRMRQANTRNYQSALARSGGNPLRILEIQRVNEGYIRKANDIRAQMRAKAESDYQKALENIKQSNYFERSRIEKKYLSEVQ